MKRLHRLAVLGAALALAGGAATARERAQEEGLFDQLVRECKLTEDQQAAVKEKIKARDEALAAWDSANAEKVQAAKDAGKEAKTKADEEAKKKVAAETKALRTAREEAGAEPTKAIFAVLTDEQKQVWAGYELYQSTVSRYRKAELTEDQQAKVKAACAVARLEIVEAGEDSKGAKEIANRLRWGIDVFVLTPEQRETVRPVKNKKTK